MTDFVADDSSDSPVVCSGVAVFVKEGVLQNRRGEDDVVKPRVVVRVDGLGEHEPFGSVNRFANLAEFTVEIELCDGENVGNEVVGKDVDGGVVPPGFRETNLGHELVELVECTHFRLVTHPLKPGNRLPVGLDEVRDEHVHCALGGGRVVLVDINLADCFTEGALGETNSALPPFALFWCSREGLSVEGETLRRKSVREIRGKSVDNTPAKPIREVLECRRFKNGANAFDERRLANNELGECCVVDLEPVSPRRGHGPERILKIVPRHQVVRCVGIAASNVVPVLGCNQVLHGENAIGSLRRIAKSSKAKHCLDVFAVCRSDLGECLFAVVRLVGETNSRLFDEHHVAVGVAGVVVDPHRYERSDAAPFQLAQSAHE